MMATLSMAQGRDSTSKCLWQVCPQVKVLGWLGWLYSNLLYFCILCSLLQENFFKGLILHSLMSVTKDAECNSTKSGHLCFKPKYSGQSLSFKEWIVNCNPSYLSSTLPKRTLLCQYVLSQHVFIKFHVKFTILLTKYIALFLLKTYSLSYKHNYILCITGVFLSCEVLPKIVVSNFNKVSELIDFPTLAHKNLFPKTTAKLKIRD